MVTTRGNITSALRRVSRVHYNEGKALERSGRGYSYSSYAYSDRVTWKTAVFEVLPEAIEKASGGGAYQVSARQLYYQVRPLAATEASYSKPLSYDYFSQNLLTQYQEENGPIDCLYYDSRGTIIEPHTGKELPIGTGYDFPEWVFHRMLYIEKEGFTPILKAAQIAEKFDMAIMAGKGFATTAARALLAEAKGSQNIEIFVLHDCDPDGYNVKRTIEEATKRMPDHSLTVEDIGLTVADSISEGLETESFSRQNKLGRELLMTLNSEERDWFTSQYIRCELNAFTAPDLIEYIEDKLAPHKPQKLIPLNAELPSLTKTEYDDIVEGAAKEMLAKIVDLDKLVVKIQNKLEADAKLEESREWCESAFKKDDKQWWKNAVKDEISNYVKGCDAEVTELVTKDIAGKLKKLAGVKKK